MPQPPFNVQLWGEQTRISSAPKLFAKLAHDLFPIKQRLFSPIERLYAKRSN